MGLAREELKMKPVSGYHPLLVALHWAFAFLIIAQLTFGFAGLAAMSNSDPQKRSASWSCTWPAAC